MAVEGTTIANIDVIAMAGAASRALVIEISDGIAVSDGFLSIVPMSKTSQPPIISGIEVSTPSTGLVLVGG